MPINVTGGGKVLATALANTYKTTAASGMLFNTLTPPATGAATGEVASATYGRLGLGWAAAANGAVSLSAPATFNLASGDVVGAFGVCTSTAKTTADVLDWYAFGALQSFASAGTFAVSATATVL